MRRPEEALELIRQFVFQIYQLNLDFADTDESAAARSSEFRIHERQQYLSPAGSSRFFSTMEAGTIYGITDILRVQYDFFLCGDRPVMAGPYCSRILREREAEKILEDYRIDDLTARDLLACRSRFPVLEEGLVHRISDFLLQLSGDRREGAVQVVRIDESCSGRPAFPDPEPYPGEMTGEGESRYGRGINSRYQAERRFMEHVEAGNAGEAIRYLRKLEQDVAYLKEPGTTMENERIGAAIVRTNVRAAALRAGITPQAADRLSMENTKAVFLARTTAEIQREKEAMVRHFCREIHSCRDRKYSGTVRSVIYELEHHYAQEITVRGMAEELEVTPGYLTAQFKKETGCTPVAFLRAIRMKQGAKLLVETSLPVREIAGLTGIADENYFIRLFCREYGQTPGKFRRYHTAGSWENRGFTGSGSDKNSSK